MTSDNQNEQLIETDSTWLQQRRRWVRSHRPGTGLSILLVLFALSGVVTLLLLINYMTGITTILVDADALARSQTTEAALLLENELQISYAAAERVAAALADGHLSAEELTRFLRQTLFSDPVMQAIGVAYVPYTLDQNRHPATPFYFERPRNSDEETVQRRQVFNLPVSYPTASGQTITRAVVFVDYALETLQEQVFEMEIGETGYAFILDSEGRYIVHPNESYVRTGLTIFDIAEARGDNALARVGELATRGQSGEVEYHDEVSGLDAIVYYEPIPSTGWMLGGVFIQDELFFAQHMLRGETVQISLALIALLSFLAMIVLRVDRLESSRLWAASIVASLLATAVIAFTWYLEINTPVLTNGERIKMTEQASLQRFLRTHIPPLSEEEPIYLPTGIEVNNITFTDFDSLAISGVVWQKLPPGTPETIIPGFDMPAAQNLSISPAYDHTEGGARIVGWNFKADMTLPFDYSLYPLDSHHLDLLIRFHDPVQNIILTPDLAAYRLINPVSLPGINDNLKMLDWNLKGSFFNYRLDDSRADYGVDSFVRRESFPEMYFTIYMQRVSVNPFMMNVLPLLVVACILFAILNAATSDAEKSGRAGIRMGQIFGPNVSLFFAVILAHVRLRSEVTAAVITYIEWFYVTVQGGYPPKPGYNGKT